MSNLSKQEWDAWASQADDDRLAWIDLSIELEFQVEGEWVYIERVPCAIAWFEGEREELVDIDEQRFPTIARALWERDALWSRMAADDHATRRAESGWAQ